MRIAVETLCDGRYVLGETLGHGGTAVVVRAQDTTLGRTVAIKLLAENLAADARTRERFLREARTAARWSHPHLVQVFDAGEENERPFMVMEFISGPNLAQDLRMRGRFPADEVRAIGAQVASGLAHVHAEGLVHRDVKPANLMRCADGRIVMTDFGIALDPEQTALTEMGTLVGTLAYLAPERATGAPASPAEDIYAVGVCMYEMLTGAPPFAATTLPELIRLQQDVPAPSVAARADDVPASLDGAVAACLAREPAARPTAEELSRALSDRGSVDVPFAAPAGPGPSPGLAPGRPRSTEVMEVGAAETVRLRAPEEPQPSRVAEVFGPRRLWTRVGALVALALGTLLLVATLVGGVTPDQSGDAPERAPAAGEQSGSAPASDASTRTSGSDVAPTPASPADAAEDLARWLRSNAG